MAVKKCCQNADRAKANTEAAAELSGTFLLNLYVGVWTIIFFKKSVRPPFPVLLAFRIVYHVFAYHFWLYRTFKFGKLCETTLTVFELKVAWSKKFKNFNSKAFINILR